MKLICCSWNIKINEIDVYVSVDVYRHWSIVRNNYYWNLPVNYVKNNILNERQWLFINFYEKQSSNVMNYQ